MNVFEKLDLFRVYFCLSLWYISTCKEKGFYFLYIS